MEDTYKYEIKGLIIDEKHKEQIEEVSNRLCQILAKAYYVCFLYNIKEFIEIISSMNSEK